MNQAVTLAAELGIIFVLLLGFAQFRTPEGARRGNITAAIALALAAAVVLWRNDIQREALVVAVLAAGGTLGWVVAARVRMIQIPAMVAFQHGAGGVAAFLVSYVELSRYAGRGLDVAKASGLLGLVLGAATFSGSLVASGKLVGLLNSKPVKLPAHGLMMLLLALLVVAFAVLVGLDVGGRDQFVWGATGLVVLAIVLGGVFAIRIGGADMPVLISFLNATAGVAAAFCGVIIHNRLLVACGATVAASGTILTHVMCTAMNRSVFKVFLGFHPGKDAQWLPVMNNAAGWSENSDAGEDTIQVQSSSASTTPRGTANDGADSHDPLFDAASAARTANRVVIAPGYGMALAQAQFEVVELAKVLQQQGKEVCFAIHPVAGRMPGHMNVLLAEADASYDLLAEMDEVNPRLEATDLAVVVGASDVVNPAAGRMDDSPISGMPILAVHEAKRVVVCNLDASPGYSGVDNLLYEQPHVILLFGDAKDTLTRLIGELTEAHESRSD